MQPKVIKTHDWISVDFGNGRRLTVGRSGEKASGAVPYEVFDRWSKMLRQTGTGTCDERIQQFVANIDSIWPDWSVPPKKFSVGDRVEFDFGKRDGIRSGVIVKALRTNYTVDFGAFGRIRISGDMLAAGK